MFLRFRYLVSFFLYSIMSECHRLGIKNFKTIRYPGEIKLAFDLCTDDISAPRYVSSKGDHDDYNTKKIDYFPIKGKYQYSELLFNFMISSFYWIFHILWISLKYSMYVMWCLFKIFRSIIFRALNESKKYQAKPLVCHPIQCYHHQHQ